MSEYQENLKFKYQLKNYFTQKFLETIAGNESMEFSNLVRVLIDEELILKEDLWILLEIIAEKMKSMN